MHLRWELYPVAHEGKRAAHGGSYLEDFEWWNKKREKNMLGELGVMLPEIFLLKGLWEYNRKMWFPSFCLHHGLYWLIGTMFLLLVSSIFDTGQLMPVIAIFGIIGYTAGTIGALSLLFMRLTNHKLKSFSSFATYFNLILLLSIFVSGGISVLIGEHFAGMSAFSQGLVTATFSKLTAPVAIHVALAVFFVLYLPFTHMTHFFTKYFTYHSVRWNDEPNIKGGKLAKQLDRLLGLKPTWSAKHIGADGNKNWAEIATSEVPEDVK
jgi:nitrate reductase gamma subunit